MVMGHGAKRRRSTKVRTMMIAGSVLIIARRHHSQDGVAKDMRVMGGLAAVSRTSVVGFWTNFHRDGDAAAVLQSRTDGLAPFLKIRLRFVTGHGFAWQSRSRSGRVSRLGRASDLLLADLER